MGSPFYWPKRPSLLRFAKTTKLNGSYWFFPSNFRPNVVRTSWSVPVSAYCQLLHVELFNLNIRLDGFLGGMDITFLYRLTLEVWNFIIWLSCSTRRFCKIVSHCGTLIRNKESHYYWMIKEPFHNLLLSFLVVFHQDFIFRLHIA